MVLIDSSGIQYAAIFLIGAGISLLSANLIVALSYMLPAITLYLVRISDEEKMMIEQFGDEYILCGVRVV